MDSEDTSVLEAESMSTEPTGPVSISVPVLHPERGHPAGGGHGLSGPSADRQVAVTLRAPSGHVGPPATTDLFRIDRRTEDDAITRPGFDISPTTPMSLVPSRQWCLQCDRRRRRCSCMGVNATGTLGVAARASAEDARIEAP